MNSNNYLEYLINSSYKSAVKSKEDTNVNLSWYEEKETSQKPLFSEYFWIDSDFIPEVAPILEDGETYDKVVHEVRIPVLKRFIDLELKKVERTSASFYNEELKNSIESSFGEGYTVIIKDSTDEEIPFGLNKWSVDSSTGTLSFLEGFPKGYIAPLKVSFYKYVGRKGTSGLITTDGKNLMETGYVPTEDLSVATKEYVDINISETDEIVKKLIPRTPDTFENKDLSICSEPHMRGSLLTSTDPEIDVVYDGFSADSVISISVPDFYRPDKGIVSLYVNNNEIYKRKCEELVIGLDEIFKVLDVFDPYKDDIVSDGFYQSVRMVVNLDTALMIVPYIPNPDYPIAEIKVCYTLGNDKIFSNPLVIGLDGLSKVGRINVSNIVNVETQRKYISGVPALVAGDKFDYDTQLLTLRKFKKDSAGHLTFDNLLDTELMCQETYPSFNPIVKNISNLIIPENLYQEKIDCHIVSYNLEGINSKKDICYPIRIDSVSNEDNRVVSPDEKGENFGAAWDIIKQSESLEKSKELQMLNGQYQWPRGDYSENGKGLEISDFKAGPDYTDLSLERGERFVTLSFDIDYSNGFFVEFENLEGVDFDLENMTIPNFTTFRCKIINDTFESEWLKMNVPYDGVLNPNNTESKGCLVVDKSNIQKRYYTFGTDIYKGKVLINIGFKYNPNIKFKNLIVTGNI